MSFNNVDSFLERMNTISPSQKKKTFEKKRQIEKIFCNFPGNFGKYQLLPFTSVVSNFPYVALSNTREVQIPRSNTNADGTLNNYSAWIRLLPKSAYTIKDPSSGREVSSLTSADESLLDQAYTVFDELWSELDMKNNLTNPDYNKLIRRKNYTIFHAYAPNFWKEGNTRSPERTGFCGLFVITAKGFMDTVSGNIEETNITSGASNPKWLDDIYNRETKDRKGFIMMSIGKNKSGQPGFDITITHQLNAEAYLSGVTVNDEDAELMQNPVESFLGWQANRSDDDVPVDQRKLFNKALIQETIEFLTDQLAKIRIAKQSGTSVADAIKATNETALKNSQQKITGQQVMGQTTNDPILAEMSQKEAQPASFGESNVQQRNDNPFANPAAAHMDPVTGAPVSDNASSFGNPGFGGGSNLPF